MGQSLCMVVVATGDAGRNSPVTPSKTSRNMMSLTYIIFWRNTFCSQHAQLPTRISNSCRVPCGAGSAALACPATATPQGDSTGIAAAKPPTQPCQKAKLSSHTARPMVSSPGVSAAPGSSLLVLTRAACGLVQVVALLWQV